MEMQLTTVHLAKLAGFCIASAVVAVILVAVYRLKFHPLSHIPGPRLAAVTWFYEIYYNMVLPGQYVFKIQELHKQYGPVIRVTPDEVHVNDVQYLDYIYAGPTQHRDRPGSGNLDFAGSLAGTANFHVHKQRRKAMGTFFSKQAITELEGSIQAKIEDMSEFVDRHAREGTVVNLSDLLYGLAWDVVFGYCFGVKSDLVVDEAGCARVRRNLQTLLQGVHINRHFPWIKLLGGLPVIGKSFIPPGIFEMIRIKQTISENIEAVFADPDGTNSDDGKEKTKNRKEKHEYDFQNRSIFYEILNNPHLPAAEKTFHRLRCEGSFLVLAGTESTAASIKITLFHILNNPTILKKVQDELASLPSSSPTTTMTMKTSTLQQLEQLPYLTACIHEGNRLSFGVTVRNVRLSPTPLVFNDHNITIPPNYRVSTTSLAVSGNETIFLDPLKFDPERWLGPRAALSKKYEFAFGRGARRCIGINLALAELYLSLATLLARFEFTLFETDEGDVRFRHDYQVAHPRLDSKGVRATVKRRG